jgi:predicted dehydrogenase
MLDLGIYTVNFSQFVHGGKRPSKVIAAGHLFPSKGVDSSIGGVLIYDNGGTAIISTNSRRVIQSI